MSQNRQDTRKTKPHTTSAPWTKKDEDTLRSLYPEHSNHYIAQVLQKTKTSIDQKASVLRLKKSLTYRKKVSAQNNTHKSQTWTQQDLEYLRSNYLRCSYAELAKSLQRSVSSVSQKARRLNLHRSQ